MQNVRRQDLHRDLTVNCSKSNADWNRRRHPAIRAGALEFQVVCTIQNK
jgi:hypothetical protein